VGCVYSIIRCVLIPLQQFICHAKPSFNAVTNFTRLVTRNLNTDCRNFVETSHNHSQLFLQYWL